MRDLSKDEAHMQLDIMREQLGDISDHATKDSPFFPVFCDYARAIIRSLGDTYAPEIIELLANTFTMSTVEMASALTDPLPTTAVIDLPEVDLYEVLGEDSLITRYLRLTEQLESPTFYHLGGLMTAVSASMRRRGVIDMEFFQVYPNLYTLLIGDSGVKKSSAAKFAIDIVRDADTDLHVMPREASPQAAVAALQARHTVRGISDGLFYSPELSVTFSEATYKRDFGVWISEWYDSDEKWDRQLQSTGLISLENLYITQLGCSNQTWLRNLPKEMIKGGYFPRTWILYANKKRVQKWKPRLNKREREAIVNALRRKIAGVPETLRMSPDADRMFERWYEHKLPKLAEACHPSMKEYYQRIHIIAMKIAAVLHVIDDTGDVISSETAAKAITLVELSAPGTETVLRDISVSSDGELVQRILDRIKDNGGRIAEKKLVRTLQLHYAPPKIHQTLAALKMNETIHAITVGAQRWYMIADGE